MARSEDSPGRYLSIHYLRAVAALMVVVYHVFSHRLVIAANPDHVLWLKDGIAIFFVISGFVMVSSTSHAPFRPLDFFRRRLLRIVPLYWFLTCWYALITSHMDWPHLLHSLLFLPEADATGATKFPVIDAGWTLNLEMAFYGLFALSMMLPRRAAVWSLCFLLALLASLQGLRDTGMPTRFYLSPFWWDFIAGMLIARLNIRAPAWCLPLGFALLAFGPLLFDTRLLATSLPAALIVASARSLDGVLRSWRLPVMLGEASYAIYLTHLFLLFALSNSFGETGNPILILLLAIPGSIALGIATHLAVERPLAGIVRYRQRPAAPENEALLSR